jgi:uncharacterized protein YdeI (BOF family)
MDQEIRDAPAEISRCRQLAWVTLFGLQSVGWVVTLLVTGAVPAGCHRQTGTVLGKAPSGDVRNIVAVRAGDTPPIVTVKGAMVEKCPVAGCWFYLQDATGVIKVDTKAAGFVVVNVPLQTQVTVSGKVSNDGQEVIIEGSGLRY